MSTKNYGKLTTGLLAAWFAFALVASAFHLYENDPQSPPLALGLAVFVPVLAFFLWFAASQGFRGYLLALNPRALTMVHAWRTVGIVFLVLYTYNILPGIMALPAGWGDIAIGVTAPLVAMKFADPAHRRTFITWQALGILDLVAAIVLGSTAAFLDPHGIPTTPMTRLPLSLIPTFAVPLLLILHVICIGQAIKWRERSYSDLPLGVRA